MYNLQLLTPKNVTHVSLTWAGTRLGNDAHLGAMKNKLR